VRHYHQRGLLAEPVRDASGYRRYDASAVVDLIRIRTLAQAGVPLAKIEELLSAGPRSVHPGHSAHDKAMAAKDPRPAAAPAPAPELAGGERLFPAGRCRRSARPAPRHRRQPRTVQMERMPDPAVALSPERVQEWQEQKRSALASAEFGSSTLPTIRHSTGTRTTPG